MRLLLLAAGLAVALGVACLFVARAPRASRAPTAAPAPARAARPDPLFQEIDARQAAFFRECLEKREAVSRSPEADAFIRRRARELLGEKLAGMGYDQAAYEAHVEAVKEWDRANDLRGAIDRDRHSR